MLVSPVNPRLAMTVSGETSPISVVQRQSNAKKDLTSACTRPRASYGARTSPAAGPEIAQSHAHCPAWPAWTQTQAMESTQEQIPDARVEATAPRDRVPELNLTATDMRRCQSGGQAGCRSREPPRR